MPPERELRYQPRLSVSRPSARKCVAILHRKPLVSLHGRTFVCSGSTIRRIEKDDSLDRQDGRNRTECGPTPPAVGRLAAEGIPVAGQCEDQIRRGCLQYLQPRQFRQSEHHRDRCRIRAYQRRRNSTPDAAQRPDGVVGPMVSPLCGSQREFCTRWGRAA